MLLNDTLPFLREIKENNTKEWFAANKPRYDAIRAGLVQLSDEVMSRLNGHDLIEKAKIYRIYANNRFHKPEFPYKKHVSFSYVRATQWRRGGYYVHIEPGDSFVAGGFWNPEPEDLAKIRAEIAADTDRFREILADPTFLKFFGQLTGEALKTVPKGYKKDDPAADLIRFQQFLMVRPIPENLVNSPKIIDFIDETFRAMRPFLDFMTDALTTDENGMPLTD